MIKKSLFEDELIAGMQRHLELEDADNKKNRLSQAVENLNSAAEIFDDINFTKQSDQVISLLFKLSQKLMDPRKISDPHIQNLNPNKMVENLKDHGTPFNMADDGSQSADDNALEIEDEESEEDLTFEDEG